MGKRKAPSSQGQMQGQQGGGQKQKAPIPVTLLSGFLGSGKTTTLNHLLANTLGKKIVVIVNDMSVVNIDARLVHHSTEKLIELSNGCICCTLREDLLAQLLDIGATSDADAIIIESTGISEPIHVAETFAHSKSVGRDLDEVVRLDTTVTVVDAKHFFAYFKGIASPGEMLGELKTCPAEQSALGEADQSHDHKHDHDHHQDHAHAHPPAAAEERTLIDLLIDQVQFADVLLLNKTDAVSAAQLADVLATLADLNPHAKIIQSEFGRVAPEEVIGTGLFSYEKAERHADWFAEEWGTSLPESEEYGISSFVFSAHRPFHPARLHAALLHARELTGSASEELEQKRRQRQRAAGATAGATVVATAVADTDTDTTTTAAGPHPMAALIRSKGFVWLATRSDHYVQMHVAGGSVHMSRGGRWWADVPREQWPKDKAFKKEVLSRWQEPHGDRAQTLVCIGLHMDRAGVEAALEACLLTPAEMAAGMDSWRGQFDDSLFPSTEPEEEEEGEETETDGAAGPAQTESAREGAVGESGSSSKGGDKETQQPKAKKQRKK
jgi:G3E family GTPase